MRRAAAVALAIAGVGSAAYFLPQSPRPGAGFDEFLPPSTATSLPPAVPAPATAAIKQPRVFSASQPLVGDSRSKNDVVAVIEPAVPRPSPTSASPIAAAPAGMATANAARKLSSSRPADEDARSELVKDLQRELKRVGCYNGEVNGVWGSQVKSALTSFTERVNATLPLNEPDYILLTLVQGHGAQACGQSCPNGQGLSDAGKCVPRAILAQAGKRGGEKPAAAQRDDEPTVKLRAEPRPAVRPAPPQTARATSAWSTVVTAPQPQPQPAPAIVAAQPVAPLPGRMAIGAPIDNSGPSAKGEAGSGKAKAAVANDTTARRDRDEATSAKLGTIAALTIPVQPDTAGTNDGAPPTAKKNIQKKPPAEAARAATPAPLPARRPPPAQRPTPPYGIGALATSAPRPSYAPQPTRWTRTIFNDITRGR